MHFSICCVCFSCFFSLFLFLGFRWCSLQTRRAHIFEMFRVKEILLSQFQHVYVVTNCVLCADKFRLFLLTLFGAFFNRCVIVIKHFFPSRFARFFNSSGWFWFWSWFHFRIGSHLMCCGIDDQTWSICSTVWCSGQIEGVAFHMRFVIWSQCNIIIEYRLDWLLERPFADEFSVFTIQMQHISLTYLFLCAINYVVKRC